MFNNALASAIFISLSILGYSQESKETSKKIVATSAESVAEKLLFDKDYKQAALAYEELLKTNPENRTYNYNLGLCYLNADFDKQRSIPFFQKVLFYDNTQPIIYYLLGKGYQAAHDFDRAIEMFQKYIEYYTFGTEFSIDQAKIEIEYCENAYELIKFPVKCKFENLGKAVNSAFPDYFPFVSLDESLLVFTSKREDGSERLPDNTFSSNLYYSKVVDGQFFNAREISGIEEKYQDSEAIIGMNGDGTKVLLMKEIQSLNSDIYEADFSAGELTNIKALPSPINTKYREIAATFNADGDMLYFVSDRPGGFGGTDIWISKKLPNGEWGAPFNAGPSVNTERDEDFPNLSPDGKRLFFSSKGHFSMGGFDIFEAIFNADSNRFLNPRNLGYPINSIEDDMNFRISGSGRYGYISALRADGYGDQDLYRLTIEHVESEYTILKGVLSSMDETHEINEVTITVSDKTTNELQGVFSPNPHSKRYVIALKPGFYNVFIDAKGFEPTAFDTKVFGKSSFESEIEHDLRLMPKN